MKRPAFYKTITVLLIALFLTMAATGCNSSVGEKSKQKTRIPKKLDAKSEAVKDWKVVRSQDKKLGLKVPQDWQVKTAKELALGPGKLFAVFGPKEGEYTSNVQVSRETASGAGLSIYVDQFEKNSREDEGTKELKVIEEGEVDSPLGEAYRKKYNYVLDSKGQVYDLTFDAFYLRDGNDYYVVQLVASDDNYKEIDKTFDDILGTLTIK